MRLATVLITTMLLAPSAPSAETLGRLFLTPAQRQALDRQRQQNPWFAPDNEQLQSHIEINGVIEQSGQAKTRWINAQASEEHIRIAPTLAVGERLNPATGARTDLLPAGAINIHVTGKHR